MVTAAGHSADKFCLYYKFVIGWRQHYIILRVTNLEPETRALRRRRRIFWHAAAAEICDRRAERRRRRKFMSAAGVSRRRLWIRPCIYTSLFTVSGSKYIKKDKKRKNTQTIYKMSNQTSNEYNDDDDDKHCGNYT